MVEKNVIRSIGTKTMKNILPHRKTAARIKYIFLITGPGHCLEKLLVLKFLALASCEISHHLVIMDGPDFQLH